MNTLIHRQRIELDLGALRHLGRALARAFPATAALFAFAVVFAASVALRLATLGGTNPSVAAAVHRALVALGLSN